MDSRLETLKRYSNWGKSTIDLGFSRRSYTDLISQYIGNRLIKVLTGQRRAGKSFILRQLAAALVENGVNPENILYINKELMAFDFLADYHDLQSLLDVYLDEIKPQGRVYIFIDEVQGIEGWERFVNSCSQDPMADFEIFISGSNSKMLSSELATLLSGRYVQFTIFPLSFSEYCGVHGLDENKQSYMAYLQDSGLPELMHLTSADTVRHYISSLKDTILLKDIIQRNKVADSRLLEDVFVYVINNISNLFSITNVVNYMKSRGRKTSFDTIATYLGYFADTYLIHKAERWNIRGRDTLAGISKYYVNDLAFNNHLYQGFGGGTGYRLENLIYLDLLRAGFDVYVGVFDNKEVDFVAIRGDRTIYVQASYLLADEATIEREYSSLLKIPDSYEKYIVTLDEVGLPANLGIRHVQAWNFYKLLGGEGREGR